MRFGTSNLGASSMSASFTTWGVDTQQVWAYAIQAVWGGPAVGTFTLQVSNDNVNVGAPSTNPAGNVVNWSDYTGSAYLTTAAAGSSSYMWNVNTPGYRWVRLNYTASSGGGSLSAANYFEKGA